MDRARLLEELALVESHIAVGEEAIHNQQRAVAELEAAGLGDSSTAKNARALLETMERQHAFHVADRERIRRLLTR